MIVISMNNAPPRLRGFLTKYLWEISTGVYVGNVNARIRDAIWKRIRDNVDSAGRAVIVYPDDNEQGFDFDIIGSAWTPLDYEGLKLIMRPSEKILSGGELTGASSASRDRLENEYVVIDLETTGLSVSEDRILEIGAIRVVNGECRAEFNRLIKTHVPDEIMKLTGITQEMADDGVNVVDALNEFANFLGGRTAVGYNIRMFDAKLLKKECMRNGVKFPLRKVVDVLDLSRRSLSGVNSYSMKAVAEYLNIKIEYTEHRALPDCRLCNEIYMRLAETE